MIVHLDQNARHRRANVDAAKHGTGVHQLLVDIVNIGEDRLHFVRSLLTEFFVNLLDLTVQPLDLALEVADIALDLPH